MQTQLRLSNSTENAPVNKKNTSKLTKETFADFFDSCECVVDAFDSVSLYDLQPPNVEEKHVLLGLITMIVDEVQEEFTRSLQILLSS